MSPQAIVNSKELERFARNLKEFNAPLCDSTSRLQGQFVSLGDTWRDMERLAQVIAQAHRTIPNKREA